MRKTQGWFHKVSGVAYVAFYHIVSFLIMLNKTENSSSLLCGCSDDHMKDDVLLASMFHLLTCSFIQMDTIFR